MQWKRNELAAILLVAAWLVICVSGCGRHLIFTTYTTIGVEVKGVNNVPTALRLAFKRFEGAVVPVDPSERDENGNEREMHSVVSGLDFKQSAFRTQVAQVFATGDAATIAASSADWRNLSDAEILNMSGAAKTKSPESSADGGTKGLNKTLEMLRNRVGLRDALLGVLKSQWKKGGSDR